MRKTLDDEWADLSEDLRAFAEQYAWVSGKTKEDVLSLSLNLLSGLLDREPPDTDVEEVARALDKEGMSTAAGASLLRRHFERRVESTLRGGLNPPTDTRDTEAYKPRLARDLRKLRRVAHLSLAEAAAQSSVSITDLRAFEDRRSLVFPPASVLARLLSIYGYSQIASEEEGSGDIGDHIWPFGDDFNEQVQRVLEEEFGVKVVKITLRPRSGKKKR